MTQTTHPTARTKTISYLALSVALLTLCSWISIPSTVPFTLQTFAIFAVLGLLGGKRGTLAIVSYLLMGLLGLPVFSGFRGGIAALFGTTGGYLLGFLLLALLYWGLTRLLGERFWVMALSMVLGLLLVYLFGSLWFMNVYAGGTGSIGFLSVLSLCVFPFVVPDFLKLSLALLLVRRTKPHLHL